MKEYRASHAAAGVVNPISLRRDVLTWRGREMLRSSRDHFQRMEKASGVKAWHDLELIKIFPTPNEAGQWGRSMNSDASDLLSEKHQPEVDLNGVIAHYGYGTVEQCAWVDLDALLEAQRRSLLSEGILSEELIREEHIHLTTDAITIHGYSAKWLIHCEGPFKQISGLVPVKGEVLTLKIPGLQMKNILHRGVFLLPTGEETFKLGSTFIWEDVWTSPTKAGREHLLSRLKEFLPHEFEMLDHRAGVRPASKDRRPILGAIGERRAIFNGLGARGALIAPWCADHLIDHLLHGKPLDPEVNADRFLKP
jgi:glycine/D-amino acid oxidase-like deaminating enzyme